MQCIPWRLRYNPFATALKFFNYFIQTKNAVTDDDKMFNLLSFDHSLENGTLAGVSFPLIKVSDAAAMALMMVVICSMSILLTSSHGL